MPISKRKATKKSALTHLEINALKCDVGKAYVDMVDGGGRDRGFGVRVWASGKKNFYYKFRLDDKLKYMTLGEFPHRYSTQEGKTSLEQAHNAYIAARELVRKGTDPRIKPDSLAQSDTEGITEAKVSEEPAKQEATIEQVIANFLDKAQRREGHSTEAIKSYKYTFNANVPEDWKTRPASSITKAEIIKLLDSIVKGCAYNSDKVIKRPAPGQAVNTLKALRSAWTYGLSIGIVDDNPFKNINLRHAVPEMIQRPRQRFLTHDEILTVWRGLSSPPGSDIVRRACKMILLTAQRPGEIAGMHRSEIEGNWWTIPTERTKYQVGPYRVFLTDLALQVIGNGEGFIFPSPAGNKGITRQAISSHVNSERIGKDWPKLKNYGLKDWHPQDLRRTVRTVLPELGVIDEYAEEILNHRKDGLTATYNVYKYDAEKEEAIRRWEQRLLKIITAGTREDSPPPSEFKRVLSDAEIKTVWQGLSRCPATANTTCRALKSILLTGQTPGRCAALHLSAIVVDSGVTWWQDSSNGNKTFLTETALQMIGSGDGYAFASRDDHVKIGTLSYFILRFKSFGIPKWTPADLQITAAAKIGELGAPVKTVGALEKGLMINEWELKFWLEKWEAHLLEIVK